MFDFVAFELPDMFVMFEARFAMLPVELVFDTFEALIALPAALTALPAALTALAAVLIALATALLALAAALFVPASPQAMPKALNANSVESAIIFFITELVLLSSSKIKFTYFTYDRRRRQSCPKP